MVTDIRDVEISHIARYMFAVPFIKKGDKVLDACCGVGYGVKIMRDFTHASLVFGFDRSQEAVDIGRFHFSSNLDLFSIEEVQLEPKSCDVITCFECVEHVDDPQLLIKKLSEALKPEGTLIISTPNQTIMPWSAERFPEHKQHFTYRDMETILSTNSLRIDQIYNQQSKFISCINRGQLGRFMILVVKKI